VSCAEIKTDKTQQQKIVNYSLNRREYLLCYSKTDELIQERSLKCYNKLLVSNTFLTNQWSFLLLHNRRRFFIYIQQTKTANYYKLEY
jgi:hypothetical protein